MSATSSPSFHASAVDQVRDPLFVRESDLHLTNSSLNSSLDSKILVWKNAPEQTQHGFVLDENLSSETENALFFRKKCQIEEQFRSDPLVLAHVFDHHGELPGITSLGQAVYFRLPGEITPLPPGRLSWHSFPGAPPLQNA